MDKLHELMAHQLGMAMALCSLGAEMVKKYHDVLVDHVGESELRDMQQRFENHAQRSEEIAKGAGLEDPAQQACEQADKTFRGMSETYFADMPADPFHVLSWMAMTTAGGIAIWSVLEGVADELENDELEDLSREALEFQKDSLDKAEEVLHDLAKTTA